MTLPVRLRDQVAGENGSAPAAVLAWGGVLLSVLAVLALTGQLTVAQARAATAADLAALAAADAAQVGAPSPCGVAAQVAERNGASLARCSVLGQDVVVTVEVPTGSRLGGGVRDTARAGPAPASTLPGTPEGLERQEGAP
ncbi:Rv3654c family TadE-like protein [Brachybacterium sillae]|uniref:Rv3654c family TadE-like protein n=1 Tax=Brachybacterium sillae TaxID=2810536 RepID=UPI00217E2E4A|nr:Rv3654c family TadE-like protein [Brachybacterium sillae]